MAAPLGLGGSELEASERRLRRRSRSLRGTDDGLESGVSRGDTAGELVAEWIGDAVGVASPDVDSALLGMVSGDEDEDDADATAPDTEVDGAVLLPARLLMLLDVSSCPASFNEAVEADGSNNDEAEVSYEEDGEDCDDKEGVVMALEVVSLAGAPVSCASTWLDDAARATTISGIDGGWLVRVVGSSVGCE